MNKLKLYLDDQRTPLDKDWIVVRNYNEFVEKIREHGLYSFHTISLDHDLGESAMSEYFNNVRFNYTLDYNNINEKTGYDCIKWLILHFMEEVGPGEEFYFPQIYSHSANPIGAANIIGYANNFLKNMGQPQTSIRHRIDHTT